MEAFWSGALGAAAVTALGQVFLRWLGARAAARDARLKGGAQVTLREMDATQQALDRLTSENERLRERVDVLEREREEDRLTILSLRADLIRVEADVRIIKEASERGESVVQLAADTLDRIRRGRQVG